MNTSIDAVLFDLDGTLLDTAHTLLYAINLALAEHQRPLINYQNFRQHVSGGADAMVSYAFDIDHDHPQFTTLKEQCLSHYANNLTANMRYFDGIEAVLDYLASQQIPWGIVTNKSTRFTLPTLKTLGLDLRTQVVVMADTLAHMKPHPAPLLHACKQLQKAPANTLYVGDFETDVIASRAAGMPCIAVTYGYYPQHMNPYDWNADQTIEHPRELLQYLVQSRAHSK